VGRQATFSLWRDTQAMTAFAYRARSYREVVRRTQAEGWYGQELFARFDVRASSGLWDGVDRCSGADTGAAGNGHSGGHGRWHRPRWPGPGRATCAGRCGGGQTTVLIEPASIDQFWEMALGMVGEERSRTALAISLGSMRVSVSMPSCLG